MKLCHVVTAKGKYVRGLSPISSRFHNLRVCVRVVESLHACEHMYCIYIYTVHIYILVL